jgi:hypothetical protein
VIAEGKTSTTIEALWQQVLCSRIATRMIASRQLSLITHPAGELLVMEYIIGLPKN